MAALYNYYRATLLEQLKSAPSKATLRSAFPPELTMVGTLGSYAKLFGHALTHVMSATESPALQPSAGQRQYLGRHHLDLSWREPRVDVFDVIGALAGLTREYVLLQCLRLLSLGEEQGGILTPAAAQSGVSNGDIRRAFRERGALSPAQVDVFFGLVPLMFWSVRFRVLEPDGSIRQVGGDGPVVVRVMEPFEHYHFTSE